MLYLFLIEAVIKIQLRKEIGTMIMGYQGKIYSEG